jgi:hypothetical protein
MTQGDSMQTERNEFYAKLNLAVSLSTLALNLMLILGIILDWFSDLRYLSLVSSIIYLLLCYLLWFLNKKINSKAACWLSIGLFMLLTVLYLSILYYIFFPQPIVNIIPSRL